MRVNKHISVALKLTVLVLMVLPIHSCCKHKHNLHEDGIPIMLGVAQAGTKAVIDDPLNALRIKQMMRDSYDTLGNKTGGFGVHGYKMVGHTNTKLFNNTRIYPDITLNVNAKPDTSLFVANTQWAYSPIRYWDSNPDASYQFMAYFPYLPSQTHPTKPYVSSPTQEYLNSEDHYDEKELTLHNIPNWQVVSDTVCDFMTATRRGLYSSEFANGKVTFSFNHILCQLVIQAYYIGVDKTSDGGVKVKGITLYESANGATDVLGDGSTDFKHRYYDVRAQQVETGNTADMAASKELFASNSGISISYDNELDNNPAQPQLIGSWLMVPHKWQDLRLKANRKFGTATEEWSDYVTVTLGSSRDNYDLKPGKTYTITLLFDTSSGGMTVDAIDIQNWTEQKYKHEVYNW